MHLRISLHVHMLSSGLMLACAVQPCAQVPDDLMISIRLAEFRNHASALVALWTANLYVIGIVAFNHCSHELARLVVLDRLTLSPYNASTVAWNLKRQIVFFEPRNSI